MKYRQRMFLLMGGWLICMCAMAASGDRHALVQQLQMLIQGKKAQVGVAVIVNKQDTLTLNNEVPYPMMSVFKFHQALAVAHELEQRGQSLNLLLKVLPEDLKKDTYSPLRDNYPQGNISLSVADLWVYTLQQSDNNACDLLFKHFGGVAATDAYIRSLGISHFSIAVNEEEMHRDLQHGYRNWTTPLEAVRLLELFLDRPLFAKESKEFIKTTLLKCETGKDRLAKPLLHEPVQLGHKTGTGDRNAAGQVIGTNDIGFVLLPDGRRYTIAVFVKDSAESDAANAQLIADISAAVYRYVCGQ